MTGEQVLHVARLCAAAGRMFAEKTMILSDGEQWGDGNRRLSKSRTDRTISLSPLKPRKD